MGRTLQEIELNNLSNDDFIRFTKHWFVKKNFKIIWENDTKFKACIGGLTCEEGLICEGEIILKDNKKLLHIESYIKVRDGQEWSLSEKAPFIVRLAQKSLRKKMLEFFTDLDNLKKGGYKIEKSNEYQTPDGTTWINNSLFKSHFYLFMIFLFILLFGILLLLLGLLLGGVSYMVYAIVIIIMGGSLSFAFLGSLLEMPKKVGFSTLGVKFIYLREKKNRELLWSNIESKDGRPYFDSETIYSYGHPMSTHTISFLHLKDGDKFYLPPLSNEILSQFENQFIEFYKK